MTSWTKRTICKTIYINFQPSKGGSQKTSLVKGAFLKLLVTFDLLRINSSSSELDTGPIVSELASLTAETICAK